MDGMIESHAALARSLGEQLGLSQATLEALGAAYEQWDGRGWPGRLRGAEVPIAARLAQIGEFVEVAYRVGGIDAAKALARARGGKQFDPELARLIEDEGELILADLGDVGTWDAVIEAEPALAVVLTGDQIDDALRAVANFVDLKSPYTLGHAVAVSELAAAAGERRRGDAPPCRARPRPRPARRLERDLGQAGPARRGRVGARPAPPVPDRAHAPAVAGARAARRDRGAAPGAARRLGVPARALGAAISRAARILGAADAYQAMREPRPYRDRGRPTRRRASCARRSGPGGSTRTPSRRCSAPPATAFPAAARGRPG